MPTLSYSEKLKDPRWQRKRLEVFNRDQWTCQWCRDTKKTLNVHHRFYLKGREPWDVPMDSLHTLCETCHELYADDFNRHYPEKLSPEIFKIILRDALDACADQYGNDDAVIGFRVFGEALDFAEYWSKKPNPPRQWSSGKWKLFSGVDGFEPLYATSLEGL